MALTLSDSQIERWRSLYDEFQADVEQVAIYKQLDQRRLVAKQEMVAFLNSYLTGQISSSQSFDASNLFSTHYPPIVLQL